MKIRLNAQQSISSTPNNQKQKHFFRVHKQIRLKFSLFYYVPFHAEKLLINKEKR